MIPMADNCNHSDVTVVQEIVHKHMHLEADRTSSYFTKTKYMNDYSVCYEKEDLDANPEKAHNVQGKYS